MSDRVYRHWDYVISHNQLLIRSPQGADHLFNDDHVFSGVTFIQGPTTITDLEVVELFDRGDGFIERRVDRTFILTGADTDGVRREVGRIDAESYERQVNGLPPGLSPLRDQAMAGAHEYERSVLRALASFIENVELPRGDAGYDAIVPTREGSFLIEAKRLRDNSRIRSTVMSLIQTLDQQDARGYRYRGAILIVGGAVDSTASELRDHLFSAVGRRGRIGVIQWEPEDGPVELRDRFSRFLEE